MGVPGLPALLALTFLAACARMEPPPGGPPDSTRPYVSGIYPAPGAVNVPRDLEAKVGFSEWVNPDARRSVVLSPPPAGRLQAKMDGQVLEIAVPRLDSATTYVLAVLGTVRDLNGLPLEAPFQMVFSTGPGLDSGTLTGRLTVFPGTRPPAAAFAALYPVDAGLRARFSHLAPRPASGPSPSVSPADSQPHPFRERAAYLAPADSLGRFGFLGVRPGGYVLAGFTDVNQDAVPDPGAELLALGPPVRVSAGAGTGHSLALDSRDTLPARLLQARWVHESLAQGRTRGTLRLKFSRPLHPGRALRRELFTVRREAPPGAPVPVLDIGLSPDGEIDSLTAPLEPDSGYRAVCGALPDLLGNPIDTARDEAPFKAIVSGADTAAPAPVFLGLRKVSGQRSPLPQADLMPSRGLSAYYPRLLTDSALADLGARLEVKADTTPVMAQLVRVNHHEFSLRLAPLPLKGQRLRIGFRPAPGGAAPAAPAPGTKAPAPAGAEPVRRPAPGAPQPAPPGTAAAVGTTFTLADSARLGTLAFRQDASAYGARLVLRSLSSQQETSLPTPGREEFTVDSLPEGWYSAAYFRDADGDGIWSPGALRPWTPQEDFVHFADSLEAKPGSPAGTRGGARLAFPPAW